MRRREMSTSCVSKFIPAWHRNPKCSFRSRKTKSKLVVAADLRRSSFRFPRCAAAQTENSPGRWRWPRVWLLAAGIWELQSWRPADSKAADGRAVAILSRTVDAQWNQAGEIPQVGTLLQPGRLELRAGLAQFVFYSGARVMIEGPAQIELTSANEISCRSGRLMAEVPSPAKAFRIRTPHLEATGLRRRLGWMCGNPARNCRYSKARRKFHPPLVCEAECAEGTGAVVERSHPLRLIPGNSAAFASLFDLQTKSLAAEAQRNGQWRTANGRLDHDPSLIVHIDFDGTANYPEARLRDSRAARLRPKRLWAARRSAAVGRTNKGWNSRG